MVELFGEYRHKVDAKGRLALPAKFRRVLSEDLVVTVDPHTECLYVFEPEDFGSWVRSFFKSEEEEGFERNKNNVEIRRILRSRAMDVQLDSAGRINLSASQREKVGIDKDVVVVGNEGYFEIWDAKRWDDHEEGVDLEALLFG